VWPLAAPCFDDHHVGIVDTDLHARPQGGADRLGRQVAVGEQHLDQGTGGGLIPETASGGRSVVLMVDTERAGGAGSSQRRGARHGRAPGLMRSASR